MSLAQDFYDLFKGSDIAHGTYVVKSNREADGKKQGTAKVIREPTTVAMAQVLELSQLKVIILVIGVR